ncbi:MAG: hypothetical protein ABI310_10840 [Microbacteriaceae bacterium]
MSDHRTFPAETGIGGFLVWAAVVIGVALVVGAVIAIVAVH